MKKVKSRGLILNISIALIIILTIIIVASQEEEEQIDLGWYEVADWEIEVCSSWGGIEDETEGTGGESISSEMYEHTSLDISIALQAQVKDIAEGLELPEDTNIYEISWYVQPVAGSVNYEIRARYLGGQSQVIESGSATPYTNYEGYHVEETDKKMTSVVLRVPEKNINWEVMVVE